MPELDTIEQPKKVLVNKKNSVYNEKIKKEEEELKELMDEQKEEVTTRISFRYKPIKICWGV